MKIFDVFVSREDPYWVAEVVGVRGGATEARRLDRLAIEVADLLSGLLDIDEDSIELRWHYEQVLGSAVKHLEEFDHARDDFKHARHRYEQAQANAVRELRDAGMSLRDAAQVLDLSFQRVQQLAA